MKVNYKSEITGNRTTARVDDNLWAVYRKASSITGVNGSDPRATPEHWVTAFDKEYRTFAEAEAPTFAAYIS